MMDERKSERESMFKSIAEQTKQGLLKWELFNYLPLGIIDEDEYDETPAYIAQSLDFKATINGLPYELSITEKVVLPGGKGDVFIMLTRNVPDMYMQTDEGLSLDFDYAEYAPEELAEKYKDNPAMILANVLIPQNLDSDVVKEVMSWARYYNECDVDKKYARNKLNKLCEKLFRECRLLDFHRIVFDIEYREKLMGEQI